MSQGNLRGYPRILMAKKDCEGYKKRMMHGKANLNLEWVTAELGFRDG